VVEQRFGNPWGGGNNLEIDEVQIWMTKQALGSRRFSNVINFLV
jgi:hypothetical protein